MRVVTYPTAPQTSCRFSVVELQQSTQTFPTPYRACTFWSWADGRKKQHIALALMIPFVMIMRQVFTQGMMQRRFPKQQEPRQALLFDGAHAPLCGGVQIR